MLARTTALFVRLIERFMPDPFLFAVVLTFICAILSLTLAHAEPIALLGMWYDGIWKILDFACQMILILVTGYTLAHAPAIRRLLEGGASRLHTPGQAIVAVVLVSLSACWLNWGFGLVVSALFARAVARRVRMDFAYLVAGAYSGFVVWASGLSSSIALASATHGSGLNFIEKITGRVIPPAETLFAPFNTVPTLLLFILIPLAFLRMHPAEPRPLESEPDAESEDLEPTQTSTFASKLENAWILNTLLAGMGIVLLVWRLVHGQFMLDIKSTIFIFLILSLLLHRTPIRLVRAFTLAARVSGPLLLQYPLYGGIMGMMDSGLARVMSEAFLSFSTAKTLPFWSYVSSCLITLFVPSGGGHWAVQAPIMVPAAVTLNANQAAVAMGVAFGEQVSNMVQPFWALPILAIANLGVRDIMGYCVITLVISFVVYGAALLIFV